MRRVFAFGWLLVLGGFLPPTVHADEGDTAPLEPASSDAASSDAAATDSADDWNVDVYALTEFPIHVGAGVQVEGPWGLRLSTSLGVLPSPYLDSINAISVDAGWYDPLTADLISYALKDSLVWRIRAGWRPIPSEGFFFGFGYTLAALGGGLGAADLVASTTGQPLPERTDSQAQVDIHALVHFIDVELGWELVFVEHLFLRFSIGGTFTVASNTEIAPAWDVRPAAAAAIEELTREGEAYLDDIFTTWVHTAVIGVAVGYRL